MNDVSLVCINTQTGRATRYVRTVLLGMRVRAAGAVDIIDYHPCKPIAAETLASLEHWRKAGDLAA